MSKKDIQAVIDLVPGLIVIGNSIYPDLGDSEERKAEFSRYQAELLASTESFE
ncbi:MAG: hypothetical protein LAT67_05025 [Balneolales bacterium]|nr:hypothetical protein [Balneolales bacterium]